MSASVTCSAWAQWHPAVSQVLCLLSDLQDIHRAVCISLYSRVLHGSIIGSSWQRLKRRLKWWNQKLLRTPTLMSAPVELHMDMITSTSQECVEKMTSEWFHLHLAVQHGGYKFHVNCQFVMLSNVVRDSYQLSSVPRHPCQWAVPQDASCKA